MIKVPYPEIHTERLQLRRLTTADWEMISYLRSDKEVNAFVRRPAAKTKEDALKFIRKINTGIENQSLYYWVIAKKEKEQMIGSICLWNFSKDKTIAEVGYDLSPQFQGQGIMNESIRSVIDFGFNTLKLNSIEAYTHHRNKASTQLLEKTGFKLVDGKTDKDNIDNVVYALANHSTGTI